MEKLKPVQRRVYGKRRADAPRAVFEGSPARLPATKFQQIDPVETLQARLAEVTIECSEQNTTEPTIEDEDEEEPEEELEQEQEANDAPTGDSSLCSAADSPETEATQPSTEPSPLKPKMQEMLEVRIYTKPAEKSLKSKAPSKAERKSPTPAESEPIHSRPVPTKMLDQATTPQGPTRTGIKPKLPTPAEPEPIHSHSQLTQMSDQTVAQDSTCTEIKSNSPTSTTTESIITPSESTNLTEQTAPQETTHTGTRPNSPTSTEAEPISAPSKPVQMPKQVAMQELASDDREKLDRLERKRAARKKVPAPRRSSGVVHDNKASEYVLPILNEALSPIAAQSIQKFGSWAARSANMFDVAKLAEGSYGEVYKLHLREEACRPVVSKSKFAKLKSYGDGVFKVVPLRAKSGPGSKKFTTIDEIVSEVKMLKYLDPIPGFARFREIHVVQGRFPESFQNAWDHYKKTKDDCLNPNPSNKRAYPDTQLWAIIEMDDAGCELEKFAWSSIFQIYDIFWGVAMALARAEEYAMFEHRDLHLGNVCIRSTREDGCMDAPTEHDIARQSSSSGFGFSALETTIIDYSLSRADLLLSEDPSGLTEIASSDLDKKQLFDAIGEDEDEIMQRNTYRYMRATLYSGNPAETEKVPDIAGIWAEYSPRTNLVWLLFLLQSLFKNRKPEPQLQRKALATCSPNMKSLKTQSNDSLKECKTKDLHAGVCRLKNTLEERLKAVLGLLDFETGHEDMCCAADLVAYAMDSQWLGEEDFF